MRLQLCDGGTLGWVPVKHGIYERLQIACICLSLDGRVPTSQNQRNHSQTVRRFEGKMPSHYRVDGTAKCKYISGLRNQSAIDG